jgi:uridylate kinase
MSKLFVVSLGGSLINPGEVDVVFLKKFKTLIEAEVKKGSKFIIVTGGGKICRKYQLALSQIKKTTKVDLDWIGIHSTRFNGQLIKMMFGKLAYKELAGNPSQKISYKEKILVAAGWEPGWSTDYDTVELAKVYGASTIINLSNVDYAYNKDPRKFKDAKKIESISWPEFQKIVGHKWDPGLNVPFDPIASKIAAKAGLRVIIANGKNLSNLKNILENKKFIGTIIKG